MPTDKLNLPLITGNMSADVPRDMNALAEAVDDAAGTDLATLEADGMIPSSQMRPIPGLSTHMNDLIKHIAYAEATGTANTYAVTISPAPSQYSDGLAIAVKINVDSTGAATLNVNGLGARPLKKANGNDAVGLKANGIYTFRYNSSTTAFILQGEGGNGNAQPGDVRKGKTFSNDYGDQLGALDLSKLVPENIKRGVTIDGVTGIVNEDTVQNLIVGDTIISQDEDWISPPPGIPAGKTTDVKVVAVNRTGSVRVMFRWTGASANHRFDVYRNNTYITTPQGPETGEHVITVDVPNLKPGDVIKLRHTQITSDTSCTLYYFNVFIGNELPYVTKTVTNGWAG